MTVSPRKTDRKNLELEGVLKNKFVQSGEQFQKSAVSSLAALKQLKYTLQAEILLREASLFSSFDMLNFIVQSVQLNFKPGSISVTQSKIEPPTPGFG